MPECLTCKCGNQEWIIMGDRIECSKCRDTYIFDGVSEMIECLDKLMQLINHKL
jgi:hypothetical protein